MARFYLSPVATGATHLSPVSPASTILHTNFDWESRWAAACRRDDLEGERDAQEDPNELRSIFSEPDNLMDFEDDSLHLHSPLSTPPSSPSLPSDLSTPAIQQFSEVILPGPYSTLR